MCRAAPVVDFLRSSLTEPTDPRVSLDALGCSCCCWPPEVLEGVPEGFDGVPDGLRWDPDGLDDDSEGDFEGFPSLAGGLEPDFEDGCFEEAGSSGGDFEPAERFSRGLGLDLVLGLPRGFGVVVTTLLSAGGASCDFLGVLGTSAGGFLGLRDFLLSMPLRSVFFPFFFVPGLLRGTSSSSGSDGSEDDGEDGGDGGGGGGDVDNAGLDLREFEVAELAARRAPGLVG